MTTTPKTIQLPNSQKNVIPTYAIRFTYPFDNIDSTYANTQTPFHLQDQAIDPEKFNSFWKQIYTDSQQFSKLKASKKIPKYASIIAYLLFLAGVILLIVGCIPIWKGQDNNMNMSFIIIAGILIALSVIEKITMTCVVKRYREGSLFKQYEKIVLKAVQDNFSEYFSKGLHWRGGAFGFKCIEFWYVFDEEKVEETPRQGTAITNSSVLQTETGNLLRKSKLEEPSTALSDSASDFRNLLTQFSPLMPSPSPLMQKRAELARKVKNKKKILASANGQSLDESQNSLFVNSYRAVGDSDSKLSQVDSSRKVPIAHHRASLMSEEIQSPGTTEYSLDSPDTKPKGNLLEAPSSGYKRSGEITIKSKLGASVSDMNDSGSSPSLTDSSSPDLAPRKLNKNGVLPPLKEEIKLKAKQNQRYSSNSPGESLNLETSPSYGGGSTDIEPTFNNSLTDNSLHNKGETIIKLGKSGPIELNWGPESSSNNQINIINASVSGVVSAETPENNQELPKVLIDSTPVRPHMRRPANRKTMLKQQAPSPLREIPQVDEEESEIEQTPKGFESTIEKRRKRIENNPHAIMSIEPIAFSPHGLKVVEIEDYDADL